MKNNRKLELGDSVVRAYNLMMRTAASLHSTFERNFVITMKQAYWKIYKWSKMNKMHNTKWTFCFAQDMSPKFLTPCEPSFLCNNPCHVFCGCMDVASQQETIPKLSQMYAFFNLHCGCTTNVVPNSLRLFGSSFLLSFLPFSPSSLTREIILVDVYLIFTQLSFYLPSHYTPQIQAEEITLH